MAEIFSLGVARLSKYPSNSFFVLSLVVITFFVNATGFSVAFAQINHAQPWNEHDRSFGCPSMCFLSSSWFWTSFTLLVFFACVFGFIMYKRVIAVRNFKEVQDNESYRYREVWARLTEDCVFTAGLQELEGAWDVAMKHPSTVDECKRQDGVLKHQDQNAPARPEGVQFRGHKGIEALFHKADAANSWFRMRAKL